MLRSLKRINLGQAEDNSQSLYISEISAVNCSREDEVMEEEIFEYSGREGGDEMGESWSLTAIMYLDSFKE